MSRTERSGWRDEAYSTWHRSLADGLDFLDIDWIEYCHVCKRELAVYELCADLEQTDKIAYKTKDIAEKLGVPGFVVLYHVEDGRVDRFRVRRLTPKPSAWKDIAPEVWARQLAALRVCHPLPKLAPPPPVHGAPDDLAAARLGWPIEKYANLAWPGSKGQNPDGTWGDLGWFTKELYEFWG